MKIAYFDCIAGASGDMILGALVDAGLPLTELQERLAALHLTDFTLEARRVAKNAFSATKIKVNVADNVPERHLDDILSIVEQSDLTPTIKARASEIFTKIGTAEAAIHGTALDQVHLHELGGVDTIVDVVGALVGIDALGIDRVFASPIPLGRGAICGAHGHIPLPAPATVSLLIGVPVVGSPLEVETVTPTGAALLAALGEDFGTIPPMRLEAVGYGAGQRDLPIPNVLRLLIGTGIETFSAYRTHSHDHSHSHVGATHQTHPHPHASPHTHESPGPRPSNTDTDHGGPTTTHTHHHTETHSCLDTARLSVLETNIDDLNPEIYEYVADALFDAGALDVFLAPIQMKKNRPATLLRVLCQPDDVKAMTAILFTETSTLGVREQMVDRHALTRTVEHVEIPYGTVHVKVAHMDGQRVKSAPEYEDCRRLARAHDVPLREVYQIAQEIARRTFGG